MFLLRYSECMFEKKNVLLRRTFALAISMQKYGAMRKRNSFTSVWEDGPRRYDKPDHESETVWTPCKYGHPSYERQDASIYRGSISFVEFHFVFADTGGKYSDCSFETNGRRTDSIQRWRKQVETQRMTCCVSLKFFKPPSVTDTGSLHTFE